MQNLTKSNYLLEKCYQNQINFCLLLVFIITVSSLKTVCAQVAFPLKISSNNRYLVDQNGSPFLINDVSSWGLGAAIPTIEEVCEYLDSVKTKAGCNAVMLGVTSGCEINVTRNNNPCWGNVCPFKSGTDFSTPNDVYFNHVADIIDSAKVRNMLVILGVSYLGYDPGDGWQDEIVNNGPEKCRYFGRYLGGKFKNKTNIIWFAGGDYDPMETGEALRKNHLEELLGVKDSIPNSLWMAHWHGSTDGGHPDGTWATDETAFAPYMDINSYYAWTYITTYKYDIKYYNKMFNGKPKVSYHMDMAYENEGNGSPLQLRSRAYWSLCCGMAGSSICHEKWWPFVDWKLYMNTPATNENKRWYKFATSRPWYKLVPDTAHVVMTAGVGEFGSADYTCAARASDGGTIIAYLPSSHKVTINMTKVSGTEAKAWWYNPSNGNNVMIGVYKTVGFQDFTSPEGDWVLVIDDKSLNLSAPGGLCKAE